MLIVTKLGSWLLLVVSVWASLRAHSNSKHTLGENVHYTFKKNFFFLAELIILCAPPRITHRIIKCKTFSWACTSTKQRWRVSRFFSVTARDRWKVTTQWNRVTNARLFLSKQALVWHALETADLFPGSWAQLFVWKLLASSDKNSWNLSETRINRETGERQSINIVGPDELR